MPGLCQRRRPSPEDLPFPHVLGRSSFHGMTLLFLDHGGDAGTDRYEISWGGDDPGSERHSSFEDGMKGWSAGVSRLVSRPGTGPRNASSLEESDDDDPRP